MEALGQLERLPETFRVMLEVARAADTPFEGQGIEATPLARLDVSIFMRGVNALKSTRLLLTESQWEFAAGIVRQLFELVVNVEYLRAQDDQEAAATRYAAFGRLQEIRSQQAELGYRERTNRPVDEHRVTELESVLEQGWFDDFRTHTKKGEVRWATSWSGLTTKALAEQSPNPLRVHQYKQLFSTWSEQAHGTPGALAPDLLGPRIGRTVELALTEDESEVSQIAVMAVVLFIELWKLLPAIPQADEKRINTWIRDLAVEAASYVPTDQLRGDDPLQQLIAKSRSDVP
jgi:hypothetical protein